MKTPQRDLTMHQRLNTSTTRKPKRRVRKSIKTLALLLILSGLLVAYARSACRQDSPITVEDPGTQEVLITSQSPINAPAEAETLLPPAQPIPEEVPYTHDELYCMAVVIYNEAGGDRCTDEERELVGYVVLNRVNDSRYPDTIREVLEEPGQYEGLGTKGVHFAERSQDALEADALERAWETAKVVLENRNNIPIPENVLFQARFKQGIGTYKQIGNTYFCYAEED